MQEGQLELEMPGYYQYWNYAEKKGIIQEQRFLQKKRANGCEVWHWHRGTRPRGKSYNVGV